MNSKYIKAEIYENIQVAENIFKLTIKGDYKGKPGQFYMLRAWDIEPFLSRPISIHDLTDNKLSFLYEVRGKGTEILSRLKKDDFIELLGPLGNGFDIENIKGRVAIISGGIGIAPMYYLAKSLRGCNIDFYCGFRDKPYIIDELEKDIDNIYISTDSGICGYKGYIVEIFNPKEYEIVLCCGPEVMMKKVVEECSNSDIPAYISMESHMACGVGACLGCTCNTKKGNKRVCKEGPVFLGREVIFDD